MPALDWLFALDPDDDWTYYSHRLACIILSIVFWVLASMFIAIWRVKYRAYPQSWMLLMMATILALCGLLLLFSGWLQHYWPALRLFALYDLCYAGLTLIALPFVITTMINALSIPDIENVHALLQSNETLRRDAEALKKVNVLKDQRVERLHKAVMTLREVNKELKGNTSLLQIIDELNMLGAEEHGPTEPPA